MAEAIKCPECGLVNFPDTKLCRRCKADLTMPTAPRRSIDDRISLARRESRKETLRGGAIVVLIVAGTSLAVSVVSMLFPSIGLGFGIYSLVAAGVLAVLGILAVLGQRWALVLAVCIYGLDLALSVFILPLMGQGASIVSDFGVAIRGLVIRAIIFVVLLRTIWHSGGK